MDHRPGFRRPAASRRDDDTGALHRTRRASQRRLVRTIVLGSLAVAAAIAWLGEEFGMDAGELVGYAVTSLLLVLVMVASALVAAALLRGLKRLFDRR